MSRYILFCILAMSLLTTVAHAQMKEPGGSPEDVTMAVNEPFEYAWRLFLYLNHQAKPGTAGHADTSKQSIREYDPDKPVVWETWANASGGLFLRDQEPNTSEVFKDLGVDPGSWEELPRSTVPQKRLDPNTTTLISDAKRDLLQLNSNRIDSGTISILVHPSVTVQGEFEVRMNKSTFDTIRSEKLYSVEGQIAKFKEAKEKDNITLVQFDLESKEVKAKWIKLESDSDKDRYHWRTIDVPQADGTSRLEIWGLSGLHIITKDIPQWFWTDFEHVDQEPAANAEGRPSVDPTTRGQDAPSGKDGVRDETVGSKWQYYRLRGVQLNFFDQFGNATQLANTLIEPILSGPSSCMTCHANAAVSGGKNHTVSGRPFMINALSPEFFVGAPDPTDFRRDGVGEILYLPMDFLWSIPFRARSEQSQ